MNNEPHTDEPRTDEKSDEPRTDGDIRRDF